MATLLKKKIKQSETHTHITDICEKNSYQYVSFTKIDQ